MSFKEVAIKLIEKGFYVFPLKPNEKIPAVNEWQNWFQKHSGNVLEAGDWDGNVGVFTGKYRDGALLVVDIDNKEDKDGDATILDLELEGFEFPSTYTVNTPSGGRHLYYRVSQAVKSGVNVLGQGVDIRSAGGFVVGAGSEIAGRAYVENDGAIVHAPTWLIERCGKPRERKQKEKKNEEIKVNEEAAVKRATHYLENEAPLALEGQGGNATTFKVAAKVKDLGVSQNRAALLLGEHWNERCQPPWSEADLLKIIDNAYAYGTEAQGSSSPEADFNEGSEIGGMEESVGDQGSGESYLQKMNKEFALVYDGGSHFILQETIDEKGRAKRNFLSEITFKRKFSPYLVEQGGKRKPLSQAEIWLDWKGRREYAGVCFSPERNPGNNFYNLWRGWAVESASPADSSKAAIEGLNAFLSHSLENVCGGDLALHNWLIGYFAHMVQKPWERPLTTLVFRGEKGVGKNALIDRVGRLLGAGHYLVAHDGRYLTSNFNGHLDSCLCLVLDEAFWSGDKAAEGKLKGITTAPTLLIERKGKETYTVDNLVRLIVIGNEDWLVPASADERRYAVFEVGSGRKQDNKFFEKMRLDMDERGGASLLLHYLQHFNLSGIDVTRAPKTQALQDQKVESLGVFHEWWLECLSSGKINGLDFGDGWPEAVDKEQFRNAYAKYQKVERNAKGRVHTQIKIGKLLKKVLPIVSADQKRRDGDKYVYQYRLPPLLEARKHFETYLGHPLDWSEL